MGSKWGSREGWQFFPASVPRPAQGGIKARSQRGSIGSTWWGKRWIQVLEGFGWSNRLQRGRRYARMGQVLDFRLAPGVVEAKVQGSRPAPYRVRIALRPLRDPQWEKVSARLSERSGFTAQLLAGEMPDGIEEVFSSAHVPLFPEKDEDFEADCSCPDWANPCKHIAAVHYILGEAFDRDPFLLLALRGRPKDHLLTDLRQHRSGKERVPGPPAGPPAPTLGPLGPALDPLPVSPTSFWGVPSGIAQLPVAIHPPKVPDAVLRRLGEPAFLRGSPKVYEALEQAYRVIGQRALDAALGQGTPTNASSVPPTGPSAGPRSPRGAASGPLRETPPVDLRASSLAEDWRADRQSTHASQRASRSVRRARNP